MGVPVWQENKLGGLPVGTSLDCSVASIAQLLFCELPQESVVSG